MTESVQETPAMEQARMQAALHIDEVAARAEGVPDSEKEPPLRRHEAYRDCKTMPWWNYSGGQLIEECLVHTPLIDVEYIITLITLGGIAQRLQEVPPSALITPKNVWRLQKWARYGLPVLVLSYPWLDAFHPDKLGAQLRALLPIFQAMLDQVRQYSEYGTIGIMMDYMCMPQKPFGDGDKEIFKKSLYSINQWYFHPSTFVLQVNTPPREEDGYGNTRRYEDRGWCNFELTAACVLKNGGCVWDLCHYGGATVFSDSESRPTARSLLGQVAQLPGDGRSFRMPPMSPITFGEDMRRRVTDGSLAFTNRSDMETVITQYERGFVNTFNDYKKSVAQEVFFTGLGWTDAEGDRLIDALKYAAEKCNLPDPIRILVINNQFTAAMQERFEALNQNELAGKIIIEYNSRRAGF